MMVVLCSHAECFSEKAKRKLHPQAKEAPTVTRGGIQQETLMSPSHF